MAFKGLRFAGLEGKNIAASKAMWVVVGAIAVIPLLYGALYLAAFHDPYERIDNVPVAVVNEDRGAVIAGERRNLGDDLVNDLRQTSDGLQWHFVSANEAQAGLEDGAYFMTCTVPANFSESAASVDTDAPRKAALRVEYNESENMLASQIGETVWKDVRQRVSDSIAEQYWTTVLGRVAASGEQIQTAAEGAGELEQGLVTARDGSLTIANSLGTLAVGAESLEGGLGTLASGTDQLQGGANSLASGADGLASGAGQVAGGLGQLQSQTSGLPGETQQLAAGVDQAVSSLEDISAAIGPDGATGSSTLIGGLNEVEAGLSQVASGASDLSANLSTLSAGIGSARTGVGEVSAAAAEGVAALDSTTLTDEQKIAAARAALDGIASSTAASAPLDAGLADAQAGAATAATAAQTLAQDTGSGSALQTGVAQVRANLADIRTSIDANDAQFQALRQGAASLAASSGTLVGAIDQLSAGAAEVSRGASVAAVGAEQLSAGAARVTAGAASALAGAAELANGAVRLRGGGATLSEGLTSAVDGSGELAARLEAGAQAAADQTQNSGEKAEVMSDPVELDNEYYTRVENYGTGFAPYFMALGLWVGSLVAGFVFKPLNGRLILSGANPVTVAFANYLPMAVFALVQATLLMVVLQFGLRLQIDNVAGFYAVGYLTAIVYAAVIQLLGAAFGFPGRFVGIILLMLQLTSSAGTFPIQTTPAFFQVVSPFLPMTYVVEALRQVMTGLDYSLVAFDCAVLVAMGAICFAITSLIAYRKRLVRMDDLHPLLNLG